MRSRDNTIPCPIPNCSLEYFLALLLVVMGIYIYLLDDATEVARQFGIVDALLVQEAAFDTIGMRRHEVDRCAAGH